MTSPQLKFLPMNKLLISILITIFPIFLIAQESSYVIDKVSREDLQLKRYEKDSLAEAVVLFDLGKSYFLTTSNSFDLFFERKIRVKIFSKAGFNWAQFDIPFYVQDFRPEEIIDLKCTTYNLNHDEISTTVLDPNKTYNEKVNEYWYNKKVAMPDIKEGSVIDISYKIKTPYNFNFRTWEFQHKIPVIYSEYTTKMIPYYEYISILQGSKKYDDFKSHEEKNLVHHIGDFSYSDMVYSFVMKDIPAFKDESFITSINDYLMKLNFQLSAHYDLNGRKYDVLSTWKKLSEELINEDMTEGSKFGGYINDCKRMSKQQLEKLNVKELSDFEKAKKIDFFIKSNFNWNKDYYGKFASKSAKDFLKEKTGNSADINLFMVAMLRAAGLEAYPVILSTRNHGTINTNYPLLDYFNYVVVLLKINSSSLLLDATEPLCSFCEIPSRCINDYGFVVQKDKEDWIQISSQSVSEQKYHFDIKLDIDKDSLLNNCKLITTGYDAVDYRNRFSTDYDKLKESLLNVNSMASDSLHIVNLKDVEKPFEIDFKELLSLDKLENKIIISPFCNKVIAENPFKMPERNFPIDMVYLNSKSFYSTIAIPKGYKLLTKPDNMEVKTDLMHIKYFIDTSKTDSITIAGTYELKKSVYPKTDYLELKMYFNKIIKRFNDKLVFGKTL